MTTATMSATSTRATARNIATATLAASILALVVTTIISLAAQAAGADPTVAGGLAWYAYGSFTPIGVLAGAIGWNVIRNRSAWPSVQLRWLVPTSVALSLIPNVLLGMSTGEWLGAGALGLMHVAIAAVAVPVFHRFLPLPR